MLRHQLTGSGAGTPKVEGVAGAAKKALKETAGFVVEKAIDVMDKPFEAVEAGRKIARKRADQEKPVEKVKVKDQRKYERSLDKAFPGESSKGDQVDRERMPKKAPPRKKDVAVKAERVQREKEMT